jgi:glycosyltransferase involved in cell wall biosynthesis
MKKILVLGQTPPPFGGQAIMIKRMLDGHYKNARLYHVRMSFSRDMDDMGRLRPGKLLHAVGIIGKVVYLRLRYNIRILYYPPSGPDYLPMLRDMAILTAIRWMFTKTIFHFHAAGTSELYATLPGYLKAVYRWSYFAPDMAIQLSDFNPDDGGALHSKAKLVIPNGIEDEYLPRDFAGRKDRQACSILFVGLICESKGILVLIDAARLAKRSGLRVKVNVVGKFVSEEFRQIITDRLASGGLTGDFEFRGVLTGQAKNEQYLNADIFCFPTFFESESFGLVVLEAMQFCLPVIATKWRGVQSLVQDGETGYLVPPHDSQAVADKIIALASDPALRERMGMNGRKQFLDQYTLENFHARMDECFAAI